MKTRHAPLVALALIQSAACAAPTDMAGLAGTYVMTLGIDTLTLSAQGRYTRVYVLLTSPKVASVDTGRWMLSNKGRLVSLRNLTQRWPQHGRYDPAQGWHAADTTVRQTVGLTIDKTWTGRIVLGVRPEIGWRYVRARAGANR